MQLFILRQTCQGTFWDLPHPLLKLLRAQRSLWFLCRSAKQRHLLVETVKAYIFIGGYSGRELQWLCLMWAGVHYGCSNVSPENVKVHLRITYRQVSTCFIHPELCKRDLQIRNEPLRIVPNHVNISLTMTCWRTGSHSGYRRRKQKSKGGGGVFTAAATLCVPSVGLVCTSCTSVQT